MKTVNLFGHLRYPSGCWFRVADGRCLTVTTPFLSMAVCEARSK